jgi:hypothetical protein
MGVEIIQVVDVSALAVPIHVETRIVEAIIRGPQGPAGPPAMVSADPNNRLVTGSDSGLYVPNDLTPDPLSYYILAKA